MPEIRSSARRAFARAVQSTLSIAALALTHAALAAKGPSSSDTPYLVPTAHGVEFTSILTVGDVAGTKPDGTPYRMAGIPDGLGAFDNGDGTFTVLMNHELGAASGIARAHGGKGAFVSSWIVRKADLAVLSGADLIRKVKLWNAATGEFVDTANVAFNRFCSADLPGKWAFYNPRTKRGFRGRIFMNGEESGREGRAFAHVVSGAEAGTSYELPSLGRFSWENSVANPHRHDDAIVIGLDDSSPGAVYVYVGRKQREGTPVEQAGLHGGALYGVKVKNTLAEDRLSGLASGEFTLHRFGDVRSLTGAELNAAAIANGVTRFLRPEDGAWDPRRPDVFYFQTTDRYDQVKDGVGAQVGRSRLWKMTFANIEEPTLGGTIEMVLDGTGPTQALDNLTVDKGGNLVLQEDVGNVAHNGKVWFYEPRSKRLTQVGQHDAARFGDLQIPATAPFSADEESSGVIEVSHLFDDVPGYDTRRFRYYLLDVQAHYAQAGELVEGGQLLLMTLPRVGAEDHERDGRYED